MTPTILYITTRRYPVWLTKSLVGYVGGRQLGKCVDWERSARDKLWIKKKSAVDKIKKLKFFYPDGELFFVVDENEIRAVADL